MNIFEFCTQLKSASGDEAIDLIEIFQSGKIEPLRHVGWQQRYIDKDEGPSMWQFCDDITADILKGRADYELRPVYA